MDVPLSLRKANTSEHIALFYHFHFLLFQSVYSALSHLGEGSLDDQKALLFPAWWQEVTPQGEFRHLSPPGADLLHSSNWRRKPPERTGFQTTGCVWRGNQHDGGCQIQSNSLLRTMCVYWRGTLQMSMLQLTVLCAVVASSIIQILLFN